MSLKFPCLCPSVCEHTDKQTAPLPSSICSHAIFFVRYPKAIDIYETIARHSLNSNLLKYSVKGYLLNAGLCQLCRNDTVAITNALERYQVVLKIHCLIFFCDLSKSKFVLSLSYVLFEKSKYVLSSSNVHFEKSESTFKVTCAGPRSHLFWHA